MMFFMPFVAAVAALAADAQLPGLQVDVVEDHQHLLRLQLIKSAWPLSPTGR